MFFDVTIEKGISQTNGQPTAHRMLGVRSDAISM
jgi:hypothetical protein